jgi:Ca2+-binding EF-hand superfamily protein
MTISSIGTSQNYIGQMATMRNRSASGAAEQAAGKEKPTLAQLFTKLDSDGSGSLEATEVQRLTEKISEATGVSVDLAEFLTTYDADTNGSFSQEEAMTALEDNRPQGPPPMGKAGGPESEMVGGADANGDGVISVEEAEGLVSIINQATGSALTAEDFLSTYDADTDGSFSTDEAVAAMEANRPQGPPPHAEGGAAETEATDGLTAAILEKYLQMAALGGQQDSGDLFLLFEDRSSSVDDVV